MIYVYRIEVTVRNGEKNIVRKIKGIKRKDEARWVGNSIKKFYKDIKSKINEKIIIITIKISIVIVIITVIIIKIKQECSFKNTFE